MSTIAGMSFASWPGPPWRPPGAGAARGPRGDRLQPTRSQRTNPVQRVVILSFAEGCSAPRVPVLACQDALRSAGAEIELANADSDSEIDEALADPDARLVVAAAAD